VRALLPAPGTTGGIQLIPMSGQGCHGRNGASVDQTTFASAPVVVPAFILRYEQDTRVSELHVDPFTLSEDTRDCFNTLLYRCLTPTAYEEIQSAYRLRLWRRPRWFERTIVVEDRSHAEANLREVLLEVNKGEILWVQSVKRGEKDRI
jgi:hypothetical protein